MKIYLISLLLMMSFISYNSLIAQDRQPLFKSFDGTQIHYEVQGKGFPVVLLHGFIVNSGMWKRGSLITALVEAGFQVINVDLRGNGLSDKPHELAAYTNDAELKDIMALTKHLGIKKYNVVGYSRGAILVARLLTLDKNINAAVMGGMGKDFTDPTWARPKMFEELFSGKAHLYPELQGALNYAKTSGADTLVMALLQKAQPFSTQKQLKKVKKPVLVIAGDEDKDNGNAADLAELLPNATLSTVKGNHNNTANTAAFAESIVKFLKEKTL